VIKDAGSTPASSAQATGGEHLSSGEVSSLPLNERDFSKLLLLAAGTMTDTTGAADDSTNAGPESAQSPSGSRPLDL
jgi:hypothetical protein